MRTRFARRGTRTVRFFAPLIVGGVRSNVYPGTISVPVQMSAPLKLLPGGLKWVSTVPPPSAVTREASCTARAEIDRALSGDGENHRGGDESNCVSPRTR